MIKDKVRGYLDLILAYEGVNVCAIGKLKSLLETVESDMVVVHIYDTLIHIEVGGEWLNIYSDNDIRTSVINTFCRGMYLKTDIFNKAMEV